MRYFILAYMVVLFILCRIDPMAHDLVIALVWDLPNAIIDQLIEVWNVYTN